MIIAIILVILVLAILIYTSNDVIKVTRYDYTNKKIPSSFNNIKIVHLSDIHSKQFGKNNSKLISKIEEINPDIIIMSGDIVDKRCKNYIEYIDNFKEIFKMYDVYYSIGNHELELKYTRYKEYINHIRDLGVHVIVEGNEKIYKGNEYIVINALRFKMNLQSNSMKGDKLNRQIEYMRRKLSPIDETKFNILIAHDPENFKMYQNIGMDLVFSGHVHGGVIRFGRLCLLSPRRKLFPKYSYGMVTGDKTTIITSAGMGKATIPIRLFNPPEIGVITLKC